MKMRKFLTGLICLGLIFIIGCQSKFPGSESEGAARESIERVKLGFEPHHSGKYHFKVVDEDAVRFEGSLSKEKSLENKHNRKQIDVWFTQNIKAVDANDNALAEITINRIKYRYVYQNNVKADIDTAGELENYPGLAEFVGQSYNIRLSPSGEVLEINRLEQIRSRVKQISDSKVASMLVSDDFVRDFHTITALPAGKVVLDRGSKWSKEKVFDFGLMGKKAYEKIYTVNRIEKSGENRIVDVEMQAVPAKIESGSGEVDSIESFTDRFDNTQDYTGDLMFNLDTGDIISWNENLESKWIIVDSSSASASKSPDYIVMRALRQRRLEKLN